MSLGLCLESFIRLHSSACQQIFERFISHIYASTLNGVVTINDHRSTTMVETLHESAGCLQHSRYDSITVQVRKSFTHLKNAFYNLNISKYSRFLELGVTLHLLAAEYRLNRQSFRVTYINDCFEECRIRWTGDLILLRQSQNDVMSTSYLGFSYQLNERNNLVWIQK